MNWVVLHHINSKAQPREGTGLGFILHIATMPSRYARDLKQHTTNNCTMTCQDSPLKVQIFAS